MAVSENEVDPQKLPVYDEQTSRNYQFMMNKRFFGLK